MNASSPERTIRVVSWNIHGAVGQDGQCRPERIAAIIEEMEADVVALQEVDGRTQFGRKANAFETMASLLGGHVVEQRLHGKPGREHGNLLWSRWPIAFGRAHLLPGGLEQRGLIEARVDAPAGPLRVLATHYGLMPLTRLRQARATARLVEKGEADAPVLLVGDLNEWLPAGPVHLRLSRALPVSVKPATFPARRPFAPLDRLYASSGIRAAAVAPPPEASIASDHLPLILDVRLDDAGEFGV